MLPFNVTHLCTFVNNNGDAFVHRVNSVDKSFMNQSAVNSVDNRTNDDFSKMRSKSHKLFFAWLLIRASATLVHVRAT